MTAADTFVRFDGVPAVEHVGITVSDGETFVTKLSEIWGVQITQAEDMGAETNSPSYTFSGRTITIYADGVSDKKMFLSIYGRL